MDYSIEISRRALKDLRGFDKVSADRILRKISALAKDLEGDVKRLTEFDPEYRLRIGNYRVLFDVIGTRVVVQRIKSRSEAYK